MTTSARSPGNRSPTCTDVPSTAPTPAPLSSSAVAATSHRMGCADDIRHAIYDIRAGDQAPSRISAAAIAMSTGSPTAAPDARLAGAAAPPLVVAALSGGVDSATAAALLVEQG